MGQRISCSLQAVLISLVCLIFFGNTCLGKENPKPTSGRQQKSQEGKIVVEYVSFPDALKRYEVYPWEVLKVPQFQKACTGVLGRSGLEEWVHALQGTGNPSKMVRVRKESYVLVTSCKPHSCDTSQVLVIFNPSSRKCWGLYANEGKFEELGNPDDTIGNLLKVLLVEEYKDVYKAHQ